MKKSLLSTKLPIVQSYNELKTNMITIGVIVSIQEYGLLVKLFGDLCGLVPKNEIGQLQTLTTTNVKSQLQQMFYVGQSVSCNVLNFDIEQKKITLSLKVRSECIQIEGVLCYRVECHSNPWSDAAEEMHYVYL